MVRIENNPSEDISQLTEKIYPILGGHIYFQTLSAAVQLDLFNVVEESGSIGKSDLQQALDLAEQPLRILLLGLTSLGLLEKQEESYRNSPQATRFFTNRHPSTSLVSIVKWQHFINYKAMYHFYDSIKSNRNKGLEVFEGSEKTLYERLSHNPEFEKIFQDAMQEISQRTNQLLSGSIDFSKYKYAIDVGGGNGTNLIEVLKGHKEVRGAVFDSEAVCQIAKKNFKDQGFSDRFTAETGNCFSDEFPEGADCILFSHFFTIWSKEENLTLLKKCYEHLPTGGSVILFNMMQRDSEDGPLSAALGSPYFLTLATGKGMLYCWKEYNELFKEAGFENIETIKLPQDHGVVIGTK